jgi:predicted Zn-dependent protease
MEESFVKERIESIVGLVKETIGNDADAFLAYFENDSSLTRFANNTIHQNVSERTSDLQISVRIGKRCAVASTNLLDDESIRNATKRALDMAALAPEDPELKPLLGPQEYRKTDSYCEKTANVSPQDRADIVEYAIKLCKKNGYETAGIVSNGSSKIILTDTDGMYAEHKSTNFEFQLTVYTPDKTSGWAGESVHSISKVDTKAIANRAVDVAKLSIDPIDLDAGEYTVLLTHEAVADFFGWLAWRGFNAQLYLEGRSPMNGRLGEMIAAPFINITENAYHEETQGIPFDMEGFPTKEVELVKDGKLIALVHNRRTAEKLDTEPTGHSAMPEPNSWGSYAGNLIFDAGDTKFDDMIKSEKKALLVTHFHYINLVDPRKFSITGMTRDGVFLVEDGKIKNAVKNFRFTESIFDALQNVTALSSDRKFKDGWLVPAMRIEDFRFSSKTEF